ncbi:fibronectin type III domain-containing protein [Pontiella sulfatireligans]|uniref:Amylopullulanase n=1 Tax=Pontiella sulfatireligans TaxID=2750658 RepID=A0A6C2UJ57_9BACT|nr:hypothetical protein [Pontiella sulfatireligans]VGO19236.1 hypothetical protein SCARR_01293 [Pontiella sulfatireligans]
MKRLLPIILCAGMISGASGLINTDFSDYTEGNITLNSAWTSMPETGAEAFYMSGGVADTAPYAGSFDMTNGNYVYHPATLGNAEDDEWVGVMDFSLSTTASPGTNIALLGGAHDFFDIGLTAAATNALDSGDDEDITIHLRYKNNGNTQVTLSKRGNYQTLGELSDEAIGWDPQLLDTNNVTADFETDPLSLTWTLRKTRIADTYSAVAVLSNKNTGAFSVFDPSININTMVKSNAYDAVSMTLAMGHDRDADDGGTAPLIDIAIDSMSVDQTSGNAPVLESPVLTANGGNNLVDLSWTASLEATSYQVFRSTTSGSFLDPAIGTTNGTSFVDTTALNNTTYYYFVRASATGATDADSAEVSAEPQSAATGLIVDTDFSASDAPAYADGNIDGQNRWKDASLGTSPVFAITDAAGSGFADSEAYTNNFDNTLANDVYYNTIMSNNVGDEWTGSITFQLKAPATPGQEVISTFDVYDESGTNVVGSFTGTNDVAGLSGGELFKFGLTADPDSGLDNADKNDIFFYVRTQASGRIDLTFNQSNNTRILEAARDVAGWDPNWENDGNDATNGPDAVTDPITINWTIRKSSITNTYTAVAEMIIGSYTNATTVQDAYNGSTDAYGADFMYFGMGIGEDADQGKSDQGTGTAIPTSVKSVAIDSFSLIKADDVQPTPVAPIVFGEGGNFSAILTWQAALEASSYNVYKALDIDGPYGLLTNIAELDYTDSDGLSNGTTYFYKVASVYPTVPAEALSDIVPVRPLAVIVKGWGPTGLAVTADVNGDEATDISIPVSSDAILFREASWYHGLLTYDTNAVPPLASISQIFKQSTDLDVDYQNWRIDQTAPLDYIRLRTKKADAGSTLSVLCWFEEIQDFSGVVASYSAEVEDSTGWGGGALHAAIRNGSIWYISQTSISDKVPLVISDISEELWTTLTLATATTTNMMTVVGNSFGTAPAFNDIQAVGYFSELGIYVHVESFGVSAGEQPTSLQLWTDGFNIYNADAEANADPDNDGVVNVHEWGTMGDPSDPADNGKQDLMLGVDETGTNLVYVYPRLDSEPRPVYTVLDTDNLVYIPFSEATDAVEDGAGPWNPNNPGLGLDAVTNLIPIDLDVKFIGLQITE